ncbi:hypothetical protein AC579_3039 [Pseudocercospora musae]|uniref:Uncharacterized protein n=1 Tax=Pseudocercospora musae TaxID=113226 RepID=A0A139I458_9PEZI|nr:hypothetical protein AC579_3039 [Pseudocercospora musae]
MANTSPSREELKNVTFESVAAGQNCTLAIIERSEDKNECCRKAGDDSPSQTQSARPDSVRQLTPDIQEPPPASDIQRWRSWAEPAGDGGVERKKEVGSQSRSA